MCQIIQLIISMGTRECNLWRADILFVSNITVSYRWSRNRGDIDAESAAAGAQSWTEQSQQHLFSCHISSDRAVNKGPLRPPGPLHSRMQLGARFNSPPLQHGRQQRRHCEAPRAVTKARAAATELTPFIAGQMGTKWLFMPPKDPIVIGMRMHESARIYRRFLAGVAFMVWMFRMKAGRHDAKS